MRVLHIEANNERNNALVVAMRELFCDEDIADVERRADELQEGWAKKLERQGY